MYFRSHKNDKTTTTTKKTTITTIPITDEEDHATIAIIHPHHHHPLFWIPLHNEYCVGIEGLDHPNLNKNKIKDDLESFAKDMLEKKDSIEFKDVVNRFKEYVKTNKQDLIKIYKEDGPDSEHLVSGY